jgi:hypothetical protein
VTLACVYTCHAQGTVQFNTHLPSRLIDAPVSFLDGTRLPPESGFVGQLFAGPAGTPISELLPVSVGLQFGFPGRDRDGYIIGPDVAIMNVPIRGEATIIMRAYNGATWESSSCRGESQPITILLSGGMEPTSELTGLQGFQVNCVPEPSTVALLSGGMICLALLGRTRALSRI